MSNNNPVKHSHSESQERSQRRTNYLFIFLLICAFLAAALAIGILAVVTLSSILNLPLADYLPGIDGLPSDRSIFTAVAVLLLIALLFVILARWRLKNNQSYQFVNGCPSCNQHDLIRIHRQQYQRLLAKFLRVELRSYACRNCQWQGSLLYSLPKANSLEPPLLAAESNDAANANEENVNVDQIEEAEFPLPTIELEVTEVTGDEIVKDDQTVKKEDPAPAVGPDETEVVEGKIADEEQPLEKDDESPLAEPEETELTWIEIANEEQALEKDDESPLAEPEETELTWGEITKDEPAVEDEYVSLEPELEETERIVEEIAEDGQAIEREYPLGDKNLEDEIEEAVQEPTPSLLQSDGEVEEEEEKHEVDHKPILADPLLVQGAVGYEEEGVGKAIIVAPFGLSMRTAPDKNADIIQSLEPDTIVKILDLDDADAPANWRRISFEGQEGWVSAAFLRHIQG